MRITQFSENKPKRYAKQHPNHLAHEQSRSFAYPHKESFNGVDYTKTKRKITQNSYRFNPKDNYNLRVTITKNNNTKPLQLSVPSQISFKGFNLSEVRKGILGIYQPKIKEYSGKFLNDAFEAMKEINPKNIEEYSKFVDDFNNLVKNDEAFRLKNYINDDLFKKLGSEHIINQADKNIIHQAGSVLIKYARAPFEWPVKKLALSKFGKTKMPKLNEYFTKQEFNKTIEKNYRRVTDTLDSISIWDELFRKQYSMPLRADNESFIIPEKYLSGKLKRAVGKNCDPSKGQYDTKNLAFWNRIVTGAMTALYLGNDAYNTTMRVSGDKKASKSEKKIRILQELFRVSLAATVTNAFFDIFPKKTTRSMPFALAVAGTAVVATEILGRKLVYKPILPTSKDRLEELEKKRNSASGPFASLGRILTRTPKSPALAGQGLYQNQLRFEGKKPSNQVSFTGGIPLKKTFTFTKKEFKLLTSLIDSNVLGRTDFYKKDLQEALHKIGDFNGVKLKNKTLEEMIEVLEHIPVGKTDTVSNKVIKAVFSPVYWVKSAVKGIEKLAKKTNKLSPAQELKNIKSKMDKETINAFNKEFIETKASYQTSADSKIDIELKALKNYMSENSIKLQESVDGLRNYLLSLKKMLGRIETKDKTKVSWEKVAKDIQEGKTQNYTEKSVNKFFKDVRKLDETGRITDYNVSAFVVANILLARFLSGLFLVSDSYNLTVLHSDEKSQALTNAGERGAQETARILTSTYISNYTHSLFKGFHNSAIWKALIISLVNNFSVETAARKIVGRPIVEKSKEQLEEIEKKNLASKNPIKKKLAYLIGKRGSSPVEASTSQKSQEETKREVNFSNSARINNFKTASNSYLRSYLKKNA